MLDNIMQLIGGIFYLLNKVFLWFSEKDLSNEKKRKWRIMSWVSYLIGLPAWLIIFYLNRNWIAGCLEAAGGPSMLLGLLLAIKDGTKRSMRLEKWLDCLALILIPLGLGYSLYDFGGITAVSQILEIGVAAGFLIGNYLLAKQYASGYLWFLLMHIFAGLLMYQQGYFFLMVLQLISLGFIGNAYWRRKKLEKKMKTSKKVLLLQPRSAFGNHVYLVNGLLATATRLRSVGYEVEIVDLNIDKGLSQESIVTADLIGIGVLGSPYIPQAFKLAKELRSLGYNERILFGGPIMENITSEDWNKLFLANRLENVIAIREEIDLSIELGLTRSMHSIYDLSMGEAIEALPEYMKRAYFEKEFCIFTSDGCIFNCSFCGAHKNRAEAFRNPITFRKEMATLGKMIATYAGPNPDYEIYLSTLDGLQNWETMEKTLGIIHEEFSKAGVFVPFRFLATSKFVSMALNADSEILTRWKKLGVQCIGMGVDGDDEKTWKMLRKSHNRRNEIQNAIIGIQDAGMIAEAFMIFGGPEESTAATLKAVAACKSLTKQGVLLRPYFMKMRSPKLNTKHTMENERFYIEPYLENVDLFLHIDYGMIGSEITNPDPVQREFANKQFLDVIEWLKQNNKYGCPTQPLLPTEDGDEENKKRAYEWNSKMPMDR